MPTRRTFLQLGAAASVLGFDLTPALAQSRELKISRTNETMRERKNGERLFSGSSIASFTIADESRYVARSALVTAQAGKNSRGRFLPGLQP